MTAVSDEAFATAVHLAGSYCHREWAKAGGLPPVPDPVPAADAVRALLMSPPPARRRGVEFAASSMGQADPRFVDAVVARLDAAYGLDA